MTCIYFAGPGSSQLEAARRWDWENRPISVLVSFAYMKSWQTLAPYFRRPKSLMLDSGAFTAYTRGVPVDHDALLAEVVKPIWDEAVGLDVIGDWKGSRRNAEYALRRGVTKAMPVHHIGDPFDLLKWYCANFPKVGLSCRFGESMATSIRYYEQCFAHAWPHKFHSFGWVDETALVRFPFHSADAATWGVAGPAFRNWKFKKRGKRVQEHLSVQGKERNTQGVQNGMEAMWTLEQSLVRLWTPQLAKLDPVAPPTDHEGKTP